jgi:hypothetical protein
VFRQPDQGAEHGPPEALLGTVTRRLFLLPDQPSVEKLTRRPHASFIRPLIR